MFVQGVEQPYAKSGETEIFVGYPALLRSHVLLRHLARDVQYIETSKSCIWARYSVYQYPGMSLGFAIGESPPS
jgi:hypothetical protein